MRERPTSMLSRMGARTESRSAGGGPASAALESAVPVGGTAAAAAKLPAAVVPAGLAPGLSDRAAVESWCVLSAAAMAGAPPARPAAGVALGAAAFAEGVLGDGALGVAAAAVVGAGAGLLRDVNTNQATPPPTMIASTMKAVSTTRPAPAPSTCVGAPAMSGVGRRAACREDAGAGAGVAAAAAGIGTAGRCTVGAFGCGTAIASVPVLEGAIHDRLELGGPRDVVLDLGEGARPFREASDHRLARGHRRERQLSREHVERHQA